MNTEATQQGAPNTGAPQKTKAFPEPDLPEGIDIGGENSDDTPKMVNPRDAMLADMDDRIDQERMAEIHQNQVELAEAAGVAPPPEPGLESQDQMHEAQPKGDELPAELQNDPLADYIVMDGDTPMFKTKVDGEERYIPLDSARSQLQKHVAAEVRLQQVAEERKSLEAREEQIRLNEVALAQKAQQAASPPSEPPVPDVSDQDLRDEAQKVVSSLFTGTEDEAVERLSALLGKTRQVATPRIDPNEIANQAVAAARQQLSEEQAVKDAKQKEQEINSGFAKFGEDFPDIMGDANLFRYADGLTDSIALEHPEWSPAQVMSDAGVQTRMWVESLKGNASEADPQPNDDRQTRKRNLRPMPQSRSAVPPAEEKAPPETPQSMMDEIRRTRGQA